MSKINLTEATMLALQGKLEENKTVVRKKVEHKNNRRLKKENIDVNVDGTNLSIMDNETIVDTPNATVIVDKKVDTVDTVDTVDNVEIPVEGDETVIPEEVADVPVEDETPFIEESKKVENVNIKVSDDGKDVEVTTDEGEEVEVKDETPETEETETETEIPVEESKKVTEDTDTARLGEFLCDDIKTLETNFKVIDDYIYTRRDNMDKPILDAVEEIDKFISYWSFHASTFANKSVKTENRGIANSKRVYAERKRMSKRKGVKAECRRAVKENKTVSKKEEARAKMVKERVEKIMQKRQETKSNTFKYSLKSFNESLSNFYAKNTRTIKKAEVSKLNVVGKSLVVESKLLNKDGAVRTVKLEMRPITTTNSFTRYSVTEISNKKTENKGNKFNATMLTFKNKYGVTECKYINKK